MDYQIPTSNILGVDIHDVTMEETITILTDMATSGRSHHVMTVNPEFIMMAQQNNEFKTVMSKASLKVPDGVGVLLAARILGKSLKERVAGVDAVYELARISHQKKLRIFFLGAAPGVAERTASLLQLENPGLEIAGTYSGSPKVEEEDFICNLIEKSHPHILLVAYGPPKQDLWIARTRHRLNVPLAIGVGGTFDFIAGIAKRAPKWIQNIGFEWLYRLFREPWRWRRMLTLPQFALKVFLYKFRLSVSGKNH
ncbi:MAG: WecB/TagA/CpsF family glycosyltransferase [Bacteroidota bacterium]|nr:WecB/TagA/CpsF family glycosyltransferase [Bacteroidota bacterium]